MKYIQQWFRRFLCKHYEYNYLFINNDGDFILKLTCANCRKVKYFNIKR